MQVCIVGASGQLGRRTLEAVLVAGFAPEQVVAAVRKPEKLKSQEDKGVQVRQSDYDDVDSMRAAFEGVERVLLIPSLAPPGQRAVQYDNAIAAAQAAGVRHLLHYGLVPTTLESRFVVTPFLLYAESALRTSGLKWTILRNGLYLDPIADWMSAIVEMATIPYPTGDGRSAYVSRDDSARAGGAALTTEGHEGCIYNLTGPKAVTTAELCGMVARVTGKPVTYRSATDNDYIRVCREQGEPEGMTRVLLTMYQAVRDGQLDLVTDDVRNLTGRAAEDIESYLRRRLAT